MPHVYNNPRNPVSNENQVTLGITLSVTVNGERRTLPVQTTLLDLVRSLNLEPERVAIEYNRVIVKRDLWASTAVDNNAEIEIVQFVGGG